MQENKEINLTHIEGIEIYNKEMQVAIKVDDTNQCITIIPTISKNLPPVHLKFDQIIDCASIHNEMVIQKDKSVIGRAVVGGVLLGGLGAIIGGMTGIGSKKKSKKTHYLVINYKSKDHEIKVLSFRMDWLVNLGEFVYTLKNRINKNKSYDMTETYL